MDVPARHFPYLRLGFAALRLCVRPSFQSSGARTQGGPCPPIPFVRKLTLGFIDKALERAKALKPKKNEPEAAAGELNSAAASPPGAGKMAGRIISPDHSCSSPHTVEVNPEDLRRHRLIAGGWEEKSVVAERYKVLRTHILQRTAAEGLNTLMVTGPLPGEGKTLTAINLAISISQELNHTVLLVDADLRSPSISRYFGLPEGPGLAEHLTGGLPLSDLLVHPQGLAELVILPAGGPVTQASELLNSPLMRTLVQDLKHCYPNRYVIFDLPPVLVFADALAFAPLVDGIIVVVEAGKTSKESILQCQEMLKQFKLLGFVLNKAEATLDRTNYLSYYYPRPPKPNGKGKFKLPVFK